MLTPEDRPVPPGSFPPGVPRVAPTQRIGDAERERAVTALGEHYAVGRIDRAELEARLDAAYRATTVDQLVALFTDLPDPAPFRLNRRQRRAAQRAARFGSRSPWTRYPVVPAVALLVAIAVLIASEGRAFFLLPMLWFWFGSGRRWYGHPHR
jgi:Domain of unknown function (DUF1707)